jgi:hypothetical protein
MQHVFRGCATVLLVVASYYALFAVLGESMHSLLVESGVMAAFVGLAIIGFRTSLWLVAGGLLAHGIFDAVHGMLISNPGMPTWWPAFCGAYDVVAAAYLAMLIVRGRVQTTSPVRTN